jgi:hypothetical protein
LALARSKLFKALSHFLQTQQFILIHWLVKAGPMKDFHTQSDVWTIARAAE